MVGSGRVWGGMGKVRSSKAGACESASGPMGVMGYVMSSEAGAAKKEARHVVARRLGLMAGQQGTHHLEFAGVDG